MSEVKVEQAAVEPVQEYVQLELVYGQCDSKKGDWECISLWHPHEPDKHYYAKL